MTTNAIRTRSERRDPPRRIVTWLLALVIGCAGAAQALANRTHAEIELVGHGHVYSIDANLHPPRTQQDLLRDRPPQSLRDAIQALNDDGYELIESINDDALGVDSGFQGMVVRDIKTGQLIIAFRGTDGPGDVIDDMGRVGVWQYNKFRSTLDRWARDYPNATVTGHSLGAALGQRYIADHPDAVHDAVFFQAPGVDDETNNRYRAATGTRGKPPRVPITYYQGLHDAVSEYGGDIQLEGRVFISTGGQVDPAFQGSPGGAVPKPPVLAAHRGLILQSSRNGSDANSFTTITEIPYDVYQRNRQRNQPTGILGQIADTLINRSPVPTGIRNTWNWLFGNHQAAEFPDGPESNPFLTPGWQDIVSQTTGPTSTRRPARDQNSGRGKPRRIRVPSYPPWLD